ncbi:MAG: hypothetical protein HOH74_29115 [Gemmatimonadetes bacterium]|jgi:protein arginine kinase activator|nr:hypothetical protein [Gemmatimonadota bacterium]
MICDVCKEREASIEFTTVVGDVKKTQHLCPECSTEQSPKQATPEPPADKSAQDLKPPQASDVKKVDVVIGQLAASGAGKGPCPGCGLTYEEFRKVGRLGCSRCYEAFKTPLLRLLKRIHGADSHVGRNATSAVEAPAQTAGDQTAGDQTAGKTVIQAGIETQSVEDLRKALAAAVDAEDYERAADLRDHIARLSEESS